MLEKKGDGGHGEGRHGSGDHISGGDGFSGHGGHDGVRPDGSASARQKSTGSNFTVSTFFSHSGLDGASYGCGCAYKVAICVDRATSRSVHPCLSAFEF